MIIQPTIDQRAETRHPVRVPRFGRRQRDVLHLLAATPTGGQAALMSPADRRAAERLRSRGFVGRSDRSYYLTTREVEA